MPQYPQKSVGAYDAASAVLNVTAATALATAGGKKIVAVNVVAASTAAGSIFDAPATGSTAAGNKVASIPATIGYYPINCPLMSGLVVAPGAGMVLAITLA